MEFYPLEIKSSDNSMHFRITSDANSESGVGSVVDKISGPTRKYFSEKTYASDLEGIVIVLMCRNPDSKFKQRIRFSDKRIYMDIMLDLKQMAGASDQERKRIIFDRLIEEVPAIISKYSIPDFDRQRFTQDLVDWLEKH